MDMNQQPALDPTAPQLKVKYEDPSVIKYLVENQNFMDVFSKVIRGWACLPNSATKELEWVDSGKPLINDKGAVWLLGRMLVATDKMTYLSNYPLARVEPILRVEFKEISRHLAANMEEYGINAADAIFLNGLSRDVIFSAYNRPVGDKERRHIFGSFDENVSVQPARSDKIFGIIPRP